MEELFERYSCVVDAGQSLQRVDKYLSEHIPNTSRNRIQMAIEQGQVLSNGVVVKGSYRVKPGDELQLMLAHAPWDGKIEAESIDLDVVYEDADLMIVNKPAGLVVHPGHGNWNGTLLNGLAYYMRDDKGFDVNDPSIGLVHRIDKDTSGLLLIAKTAEAKTKLGLQFYEHTTERTYNALVWGRMEGDNGTIEGALARDSRDRTMYRVWSKDENGQAKDAVTHWRVLERFEYVTLVECKLETGRTHQIRVHMKHIGHPLFGDEKYGGMEILRGRRTSDYRQFVEGCFDVCPRQALHAKTLGFVHPRTGERMFFDSAWADDFACLIDRWRGYSDTN